MLRNSPRAATLLEESRAWAFQRSYLESYSFILNVKYLERNESSPLWGLRDLCLSLKSTFLRSLLDWVLIFLPSFSLNLLDLFNFSDFLQLYCSCFSCIHLIYVGCANFLFNKLLLIKKLLIWYTLPKKQRFYIKLRALSWMNLCAVVFLLFFPAHHSINLLEINAVIFSILFILAFAVGDFFMIKPSGLNRTCC